MTENIDKKDIAELSIIIPTLDRDNEFPAAIISAIKSDALANVIVSLNKSGNKTLDACRKAINSRIILKYWHKRYEIGDHWTAVVNEEVTTEYFTLIPDDDRIFVSNYYSEIIKILNNNPACVAAFADKRLIDITKIIPNCKISESAIRVAGSDFLKILRSDVPGILDICPTHYTTILRTTTAKQAGLYPNCHSPDLLLFAKVCKFGDVIISFEEPGQYNWNENGLSKRPNMKMLIDELNELREMKFGIDASQSDSIRNRLITRTKRAIFVASIRCIILKSNNESFKGIAALGFKDAAAIAFDFAIRLLMRKWPKLNVTI